MGGTAVGKRRFHAFVSHAHVDSARADELVAWLRDVAGVPVWYDASDLPPGGHIAKSLPNAIENSRSLLLLVSSASVERNWVQEEYSAAIDQRTEHPGFRLIPITLDDCQPPGFLRNYNRVALGPRRVDLESARGILTGLYRPTEPVNLTNARNVFVSRGWKDDDATLAAGVCTALRAAGLQLIGDAEDQPSWDQNRVTKIIESCGGFAAILPYRPLSPHRTSAYVLREWELALARGLPSFVVADPRVELADHMTTRGGLLPAAAGGVGHDSVRLAAEALAEDWLMPARSPYVFYATDFGAAGAPVRAAVKDVVESVTNLPCALGEYVTGPVVQGAILDSVAQAAVVLADISNDSPNVYVEVGAARATGVPVFLLRRGSPGRPAFMLRDHQVWDYAGGAELLGRVRNVTYPYRRTIVNPQNL